jgi:response regulator RpfG family c-di-GMP phosphodiesterase
MTVNDDIISLLKIGSADHQMELPKFTRQEGFNSNTVFSVDEAQPMIGRFQPELVLIDADMSHIKTLEQQLQLLKENCPVIQPVFFVLLPRYPDGEQRQQLAAAGCSRFFVDSCRADEVRQAYEIYRQKRSSEQHAAVLESRLEKAFEYLNTFKKDLKSTKSELYNERMALNNALKQVNQMTRERSRLKKEKSELKKSLKDNIQGFADILTRLIIQQVEENRGHSERVAHIARFVAKELKLDEKKVEDLRKAAMLHEVGLLMIPWPVFSKDRSGLADWERDYFLQYPEKGAKLLLNCSEFTECARIIESMNENSDGTGRPKGLKRRYIPLLSKILAGADLFDDVRSDPGIHNLTDFLNELESYSGTRLDPNIVAQLEKYAVLHMGSDAYQVRGVGIHQLEPGMTLGTAIFTNTGTKLFSVNTLLTQDAIDKIKNYNREYPIDEIVYIKA